MVVVVMMSTIYECDRSSRHGRYQHQRRWLYRLTADFGLRHDDQSAFANECSRGRALKETRSDEPVKSRHLGRKDGTSNRWCRPRSRQKRREKGKAKGKAKGSGRVADELEKLEELVRGISE